MKLRPYQQEVIENVRKSFARGCLAPLIIIPTGGGKTATAMHMVSMVPGSVIWVAHREELVYQAKKVADSLKIENTLIAAGAGYQRNPKARLKICMIQTLIARGLKPAADLLVLDEAHHAVAEQYLPVVLHYKRRIGLTATPERSDGLGLHEAFDDIIIGPTVPQLTSLGHLVPCEILRPASPLAAGELALCPVQAWEQHCKGLKTMVFAPHVKAAKEYLEKFQASGVSAMLVTGTSSVDTRMRAIHGLRDGTVKVLINVNVFTEGFDEPSLQALILARGFQTHGPYLQAAGRVLRPSPGKTKAVILDLRGVTHVLGAPEDTREYALEGQGIRSKGDESLRFCKICGTPLELTDTQCSACGWIREEVKTPEVVNQPLVKYEKKRQENDDQRVNTLTRWLFQGRQKGWKDGAAYYKFKAVYGCPPDGDTIRKAIRNLSHATDTPRGGSDG